MKIKIVCKNDNDFEEDDNIIVVRCEACRGKNIKGLINMLKEEYNTENVEVPNCPILKKLGVK
ncbi:hypothetical protein ACPB8Q_00765 [Methanocaldococcus indicus]|uniref:hypothetical protein n=1 Tax=Methanocaldococcus indicus TaxID=213231 RepID=UPI003C6D6116